MCCFHAIFKDFSLLLKLSGFLDKNNDLLYRNGKEVITLTLGPIKSGVVSS